MIRVQHRNPVEDVCSVIGCAAANVHARRRLRPNDYLAAGERLQRIGLAEERVVRGSGHRDTTIWEPCAVSVIEAADPHRSTHLDRAEARRLGAQRHVDLEPAFGRHERVERPGRVANQAHGEMLRPRWNPGQRVASLRTSDRRSFHVGQRHDRAAEGRASAAVAHSTYDSSLHGEHHHTRTHKEAHRTLRDCHNSDG
jgi:hypothetical protein